MNHKADKNLNVELARIRMIRKTLNVMNFEPTRANADLLELEAKLADFEDEIMTELWQLRSNK